MTWRKAMVMSAIALAATWRVTAQQAAQHEIANGPNTLFGRVVDAGTGSPVGGAQITLMAYGGPDTPSSTAFYGRNNPASANTSAPRGVITDGDGDFLFGQLPAGRYAIFATAFGYLNSGYLSSAAAPIHLVDVKDNARAEPVAIRLVKGASIAGTVTDDRGEPIVDAPVRAFVRAGPALSPAGVEVRTDDRGAYRISQLPPDSYVVGVITTARTIPAGLGSAIDATSSDPYASSQLSEKLIPTLELDLFVGYFDGQLPGGEGTRVGDWILQRKGPIAPPAPDGRLLAYTTTLYPGTALPSEAAAISVNSGDERTGIDMTMRLSPTVTISGVVIGPDGPMENTSVHLNPTRAGDDRDVSPTGEFTTITSASGAFAFLGVPQGQYVITSSYLPIDADTNAPKMTVWAKQVISAGDRDVSGVALTMRQGLKVSGRVNSSGAAAPARFVTLQPLGGIWQRTLPLTVASDGQFVSGGSPPGRYRVNVSTTGASVLSIALAGQRSSDGTIVLESSDVTGLVITMSAKPLHLTGSIVDSTGAPAARANVIAFPADSTTWRQDGLTPARRCVTAATSTGAFDCSGLSLGEYYVAAIDAETPYRYSDVTFFDRLIPGAARVTVTENGASNVALKLSRTK